MRKFTKTIKFRLEDPFPWKKKLIQKGMEESKEIAEEVCKRIMSLPRYRWSNRLPYDWVKDLREDLTAQSTQQVVEKVRRSYESWRQNGYKGNRPRPKHFDFVAFHNQQLEYFKNNGKYHVELSLIPYKSFYLPIYPSSYYHEFLSAIVEGNLDYGSAELHKDQDAYWLHQTVTKEVEQIEEPDTYVGIDLGIRNIAVVTVVQQEDIKTVEFFSGKQLQHVEEKYIARRKKLQEKGNIKKVKKIGDKVKRIKENTFHKVSRKIVNLVKKWEKPIIKMEQLQGIRRKVSKSKAWNKVKFGWAFGKLQTMIEYKASEEAIPVHYVNPKNTSQKHYKCGKKGKRNGMHFYCPHCDEQIHIDFNAAMNIATITIV